jgi:hypothetical protein
MCPADALGIRDWITGDPWIHSCNSYFGDYSLKERDNVMLKIIALF